jgi:predicted glycosyltransferase
MRLLVDILHPGHVHFFRHVIAEMTARGDEVLVTARRKEVAVDLLEAFDIPHVVLSSQSKGTIGLSAEWASRTTRLASTARRFSPDMLLGIMGVSIAPVGRLLRRPALVFYDTEVATQTNRFVYPMASSVITPDCYEAPVRGNHVTYPGYHELAYLHPNRFTPDTGKLGAFGLLLDELYAVVRFVSWESSHDGGEVALSAAQKIALVARLQQHGRIVISSEGRLPPSLETLRLSGPVEDIHHVLAYASLTVGESSTMASESAVLGTPAIHVAQTSRGYVDDLECRYGLVEHFQPEDFATALAAAEEVMAHPDPVQAGRARSRMLADKIDVTSWMIDYLDGLRTTPDV